MRLRDKVAIITGAASGIGRATALLFAQEGAKVVVADVNDEGGKETVSLISKQEGEAIFVHTDVTKFDQSEELIKLTVQEFEGLQILVNNAGTTRDGLIITMSEGDWDFVLDTNLKSTFNCSRAAVRHMLRRRYGRIINVTSIAGQMGNAGQTNYSASKAGLIGFTKALAREVASRNITVNAVAPGFIDTQLTGALPENIQKGLKDLIPLGRVGEPEEIAKAIAYLASDDAAYVTGHVLTVDGGMAMF
jgi:3-oxoacyl-[acyl-carrier protein] reductase